MYKEIIEIALIHHEYNTVAFCMVGLAAEYLEGDMERSKDQFNKYFHIVPVEVLRLMIADNTFECISKMCQQRIDHLLK